MSTEAAAAIIFGVLQVSISVVAALYQRRQLQARHLQRNFDLTSAILHH